VVSAAVSDARLVSTVDVVATLLDFAGAEPLPDRPGLSLKPLLEGTGAFPRERVFAAMEAERNPAWFGGDRSASKTRPSDVSIVRTQEWRYVSGPERRDRQLYEMRYDPFEQRNVRRHHPDTVRELDREFQAWHRRMLAPWARSR
jgi:arylsulfatase A-like enzyme